MQELAASVTSAGGTCAKICMRGEYDDSVPRGLYASKPISAGDVLLSIPRALLLTAGEDGTSIPADDALILRVLAEAARADSPWAPYLRLLPPRSSFEAALPLFWDSKQIAALRCPAISARVFEQQTSLRARFEALKAMDIPAALSRPSWEDFTWAWASIESRSSCFIDDSDGQVNERQCLVPFGDSFNHHATYPSVMARFDASMDAFTFTALRGVDEGEELFVQYGPHDDATLLLTYGFVWRDPSSDEEDEEDEDAALFAALVQDRRAAAERAMQDPIDHADLELAVAGAGRFSLQLSDTLDDAHGRLINWRKDELRTMWEFADAAHFFRCFHTDDLLVSLPKCDVSDLEKLLLDTSSNGQAGPLHIALMKLVWPRAAVREDNWFSMLLAKLAERPGRMPCHVRKARRQAR